MQFLGYSSLFMWQVGEGDSPRWLRIYRCLISSLRWLFLYHKSWTDCALSMMTELVISLVFTRDTNSIMVSVDGSAFLFVLIRVAPSSISRSCLPPPPVGHAFLLLLSVVPSSSPARSCLPSLERAFPPWTVPFPLLQGRSFQVDTDALASFPGFSCSVPC